jgi:hypothetical protein
MVLRNGAQLVKVIPGRHVVFSAGTGKTNAEEIKWLIETVLKCAKAWKADGWGYIADVLEMDPVDPYTSKELVSLTKLFTENNCKAFAFIDGTSSMLKAQAKSHQKRSSSEALQGHFFTLEEALEWMQQLSL